MIDGRREKGNPTNAHTTFEIENPWVRDAGGLPQGTRVGGRCKRGRRHVRAAACLGADCRRAGQRVPAMLRDGEPGVTGRWQQLLPFAV
jgi:hypothetical protein